MLENVVLYPCVFASSVPLDTDSFLGAQGSHPLQSLLMPCPAVLCPEPCLGLPESGPEHHPIGAASWAQG